MAERCRLGIPVELTGAFGVGIESVLGASVVKAQWVLWAIRHGERSFLVFVVGEQGLCRCRPVVGQKTPGNENETSQADNCRQQKQAHPRRQILAACAMAPAGPGCLLPTPPAGRRIFFRSLPLRKGGSDVRRLPVR
ncbi:hypothetical protein SDC9_207943 [bioreactor metagenome]|uniref:Uncharacterized protein n=1 Tax=bioreactor metagenome TaxID=1076179 RepID=A0A645J979_9ZZZZ